MKVEVSKSKFRPFCRLGKEELEIKLFLGPASFFRGGRCGVCGVGGDVDCEYFLSLLLLNSFATFFKVEYPNSLAWHGYRTISSPSLEVRALTTRLSASPGGCHRPLVEDNSRHDYSPLDCQRSAHVRRITWLTLSWQHWLRQKRTADKLIFRVNEAFSNELPTLL